MRPAFDRLHDVVRDGLSPIPLIEKQKRPAITHYQQFSAFRANKETLKYWSKRFPNMNVGIMLGLASGRLHVLDPENPEMLTHVLDEWQRWDLPSTRIVQSGSDEPGGHVAFRLGTILEPFQKTDGENVVLELLTGAKPHSFIVAPGSLHPSTGRPYTIINDDPIATIEADQIESLEGCLNALGLPFVDYAQRIQKDRPNILSDRAWAILKGSQGGRSFENDIKIIGSAIFHGASLHDVLKLFQNEAHAGARLKYNRIAAEESQAAAVEFIQQAFQELSSRGRTETRTMFEALRERVLHMTSLIGVPARQFEDAKAVLLAILGESLHGGNQISASMRRLSVLTGLPFKAVRESIDALTGAGIIEKSRAKWELGHANQYLLKLGNEEAPLLGGVQKRIIDSPMGGENPIDDSKLDTLTVKDMVRIGLHRQALRFLKATGEQPASARQIATATGSSPTTASKYLRQLASKGFLLHDEGGFRRNPDFNVEVFMSQFSQETPALLARKKRYQAESHLYQRALEVKRDEQGKRQGALWEAG